MSVVDEASNILHLLSCLVKSIDERVGMYHYKLAGDGPESLCTLLGIEDAHFRWILDIIGLYDVKKSQCNN